MTYAEHHHRAEELAQIDPYPGKACGGCTACCSVVPVKEIGTKAWQRCPHVRTPPSSTIGCSIYPNRPRSCRAWACGWLATDWPDDCRPDRSGVIVDPAEDLCWIDQHDGSKPKQMVAARFWVLPGYEETWRHDPAKMMILCFVDAGFVVLWDMPPRPDRERMAMSFLKTDAGFTVLPPSPQTDNPMGMSQSERFWRARQLVEGL